MLHFSFAKKLFDAFLSLTEFRMVSDDKYVLNALPFVRDAQ